MSDIVFNPEVCALKHEMIGMEIDGLKEGQLGIRDEIKEVRVLQKQILYAIISLFGTSILILIGVIAGRAIDFKAFVP